MIPINGNEIFWVGDKVAQDMFTLRWHPGQENLSVYQSKNHKGSHHIAVQPWYLHAENSPRILPRAVRPSTLKGCVGTLQTGYIQNVPSPRVVPRIQSASHGANHMTSHGACHVTNHVTSHGGDPDTCYLQFPRVPKCSNLSRLIQGLGVRQLLPLFPCWLM